MARSLGFFRASRALPLLALLATAAACGLSLDIAGVDDVDSGAPSADAQIQPRPTSDSAVPTDEDAASPTPPDGSTPLDATSLDAEADALVPGPDAADGGCVTVLKEDFTTNAGGLSLVGTKTLVEGGKLRLLPDSATAADTTSSEGAAFVNVPVDVLDFDATFTVTTGALGADNQVSDGFAFSWLERALPAAPMLRGGNDLGMTLSGGAGQHGYAVVLDIYPIDSPERYFATNELGAGNNVRTPSGTPPIFGSLVGTGAATLKYKVTRRGNRYDITIARSGGVTGGNATRTINLGSAATPLKAFVFSTAAGTVRSPGFFLDDVEISRCP